MVWVCFTNILNDRFTLFYLKNFGEIIIPKDNRHNKTIRFPSRQCVAASLEKTLYAHFPLRPSSVPSAVARSNEVRGH